MSILRQEDVGHAECRTHKRNHTKGSTLGQRYFSDPHLPKISPVPSWKEMNVTIRITFNIHCNMLAYIQV